MLLVIDMVGLVFLTENTDSTVAQKGGGVASAVCLQLETKADQRVVMLHNVKYVDSKRIEIIIIVGQISDRFKRKTAYSIL